MNQSVFYAGHFQHDICVPLVALFSVNQISHSNIYIFFSEVLYKLGNIVSLICVRFGHKVRESSSVSASFCVQ